MKSLMFELRAELTCSNTFRFLASFPEIFVSSIILETTHYISKHYNPLFAQLNFPIILVTSQDILLFGLTDLL